MITTQAKQKHAGDALSFILLLLSYGSDTEETYTYVVEEWMVTHCSELT